MQPSWLVLCTTSEAAGPLGGGTSREHHGVGNMLRVWWTGVFWLRRGGQGTCAEPGVHHVEAFSSQSRGSDRA